MTVSTYTSPYNPPLKNTAFVFYLSLVAQATRPLFKTSPTLAAGDVLIAIDDAAPANITTLPVVDADFTRRVKVSLSAAEMNGDNISIIFADVAGAEWDDVAILIQPVTLQTDTPATQASVDTLATYVDTEVTAIKAKTDALPSDPADQSILAGLIAAIASGATAQQVWEYASRTLTMTAAQILANLTGANITEYRGTTWGVTLTALPTLTAYDKIYLSVKESVNALDTDAVLRLSNTVGLERFNKAAPLLAANGVLTVLSSTSISYSVAPAETISAIPRVYVYDLKGVDTGGAVDLLTTGVFMVVGEVTRAIV